MADVVCRRFGRWWGRCGVAAFGMMAAGVFMAAGSKSPPPPQPARFWLWAQARFTSRKVLTSPFPPTSEKAPPARSPDS